MKISIAVPSFNYAVFLEACLNSIKNQSYTDFEVLIADGGSSDGSLDIIRSYCSDDSRFQFVSMEDDGQSDAIYKAFRRATGGILCFLNADDCYISRDALACVINAFMSDKSVKIVSFGGYYIDELGRYTKPINYRYHPLDGQHLMRYRTAVLQPATYWKKDVFDATRWPRKFNYVFDVVFFYSIYQKAYKWVEFPEPIVGYRLHGKNKSMTVRPERIAELALFEEIKFGRNSVRSTYLKYVGKIVKGLDQLGAFGKLVSKCLYILVNGLAFITCYRLPTI